MPHPLGLNARHTITLKNGQTRLGSFHNQPVEMDGLPLKIVLSKDIIYIGCSNVEPKVLKYLYDQWKLQFGKDEEIVLQDGSHPC